MKKREADFGTLFRHWLKANSEHFFSAAFELKQTTGDSIPFSSVAEHQLDALQATRTPNGLLYKAPDDSRGVKPFDYFYLKNAPSFVVIKYPKHFEIINVETFMLEKGRSKRKSLTSARARAISVASVDL